MSVVVILNSKQSGAQSGERFTTQFKSGGINLQETDDRKWCVRLKSLKTWNTIPNISNNYQNNTYRFRRNPADAWTSVSIPAGIYGIQDINTFIQRDLYTRGFYGGTAEDPVFSIRLETVNTRSRCLFTFLDPTTTGESGATKYAIKLDGLSSILGYTSGLELDIDDTFNTRLSSEAVNITNDLDDISVNLNIIDSSWRNGIQSNSIETYTASVPPGGFVERNFVNPSFIPVINSGSTIQSISVWLLDNLGRSVDLRGESLTVVLEFKKIKL